jgi:phospholipase C
MSNRLAPLAMVAALLASGGCAGSGAPSSGALPQTAAAGAGQPIGKYIKHVVIIVQENRTFDNLFAGYAGANAPMTGMTSGGKSVPLKAIGFLKKDMIHSWQYALIDYDKGKMDGFDQNVLSAGGAPGPPAGLFAYSYVKRNLVAPYWTMAKQYVLADHMFATMFGQSFTGHLDLIASTTNLSPTEAVINDPTAQPWGCDAPAGTTVTLISSKGKIATGPRPCFTQFHTMADTLDAKHVSWKYYTPAVASTLWSAFDAIHNVRYGPDWTKNISVPQTNVLTDAANGTLPAVSWVIPDWLASDHAAAGSDTGPSWVAAVVNAVGQGPDWNSTAIFVVWDDWGSWYDNVAPPQMSFVGLGIRVPCIVISPYAKKNYVSHTQYEFASMLKFSEEAFGLAPLGPPSFGYTDTRANDMLDAFDFTQAPRAFKKIPAKYPASHFLMQAPSDQPPDND